MQWEWIKIEDKELDFVFEVVNMWFMENPLLEDSASQVLLRLEDGDVLEKSSDTIAQATLDEVYSFTRNKFVFYLLNGRPVLEPQQS